MIDEPEIIQIKAQRAAVIRLTIPRAEMRMMMGPAIGELMSALKEQGIAPAGAVFAHHLSMRPDIFDFELGMPVARPVKHIGRVISSQLPAAKVARTIYHGPYEGLPSAWEAFMDWIEAQGYEAQPDLWESYMDNPDSNPNPASWRTQLNRPIRETTPELDEGFLASLAAPARRALENEGITTLEQLSQFSEAEILALHGMGPGSIPRLHQALVSAGLSFRK